MKKGTIILAVAAVLLSVITLIALGEAYLTDKGPSPAIGSRISSIESYGRSPAERLGSTVTPGTVFANTKFKYIAVSKVLTENSFNKIAFDKKNPKDFAFVERNHREGVEVVHIYTNNVKVDIAEFCPN